MNPQTLITPASYAVGGLIIGFVVGRLTSGGSSASPSLSDDGSSVEAGDGVELYVGNLSYDVGEKELMKTFSTHGKVLSARIIKNKFNNRSKGYGFIEMATGAAADKAVKAMHSKEVKGRKLVVNEARSRSHE
jgi:RNA recognition motif-containing protein